MIKTQKNRKSLLGFEFRASNFVLPRAYSLNGYTLVEMLMVISLATVTLLVVTTAILAFYRGNTIIFNQALAVESARRGLAHVSADVRGAQYGDNGSFPIISIATSSFTFFTDIEGDGSAERIRYFLSGTTLKRGIIHASGSPATYPTAEEAVSTSATDVHNPTSTPIFRYYTASSTEITSFATTTSVSYITVELRVDVDPANSPSIYTLRTTATLRNASQF